MVRSMFSATAMLSRSESLAVRSAIVEGGPSSSIAIFVLLLIFSVAGLRPGCLSRHKNHVYLVGLCYLLRRLAPGFLLLMEAGRLRIRRRAGRQIDDHAC